MVDSKKIIISGILITIGVLIIVALAFAGYSNYKEGKVIQGYEDWPSSVSWLKYIFGQVPTVNGVGTLSPIIITLAIWLLVFVTFSDIIATFSSFSTGVSWIVGFCLATIAANLAWTTKLLAIISGTFIFVSTAALFIGLFASFVAFAFVNWGLMDFRVWLKNRRILMKADEDYAKAAAGGKKISGGLEGFAEVTKALKNAEKEI